MSAYGSNKSNVNQNSTLDIEPALNDTTKSEFDARIGKWLKGNEKYVIAKHKGSSLRNLFVHTYRL